jgi:hypothetical protein
MGACDLDGPRVLVRLQRGLGSEAEDGVVPRLAERVPVRFNVASARKPRMAGGTWLKLVTGATLQRGLGSEAEDGPVQFALPSPSWTLQRGLGSEAEDGGRLRT